jgi:hypothetical protein
MIIVTSLTLVIERVAELDPALCGFLSIPKAIIEKRQRSHLDPISIGRLGRRCGSSSIPDIIRIRQGSWILRVPEFRPRMEFSGCYYWILTFRTSFCPLSLPLVFAPCVLGEIVCVTNEVCLCLVVMSCRTGHFTSVDMSGNLSEPSVVSLPGFLILNYVIQIEGSDDFNFSNTKDALFTIWWESIVRTLKPSAIVPHF